MYHRVFYMNEDLKLRCTEPLTYEVAMRMLKEARKARPHAFSVPVVRLDAIREWRGQGKASETVRGTVFHTPPAAPYRPMGIMVPWINTRILMLAVIPAYEAALLQEVPEEWMDVEDGKTIDLRFCPKCKKPRTMWTLDGIEKTTPADTQRAWEAAGECCHPKCKGIWGTGCWHCHSPHYFEEEEQLEEENPEVAGYDRAIEALRRIAADEQPGAGTATEVANWLDQESTRFHAFKDE